MTGGEERNALLLRLIEEALKRIDRGEFGRCMNCGTPIPEPRLQVEPWARYCIKCQSELDAKTKAVAGYNRRGSKDSQLR